MRLTTLSLTTLALLLGVTAAQAANRALPNLLGYSEDGRYFAYEQFYIGDASGAPFDSITIIDLDSQTPGDRLAYFEFGGTEDDLLGPARQKVAAEAAADLARYKITEPGEFVAMVGDGDAGANGFALRFGQPGSGPIGEVYQDQLLKLSSFDLADKGGCTDYDVGIKQGVTLDIVRSDGRHQAFTDGDAIPDWRGCATDYHLYAVVLPSNTLDMTRALAMISVYTAGWEGSDRAFLVLPIGK